MDSFILIAFALGLVGLLALQLLAIVAGAIRLAVITMGRLRQQRYSLTWLFLLTGLVAASLAAGRAFPQIAVVVLLNIAFLATMVAYGIGLACLLELSCSGTRWFFDLLSRCRLGWPTEDDRSGFDELSR